MSSRYCSVMIKSLWALQKKLEGQGEEGGGSGGAREWDDITAINIVHKYKHSEW